MVKITWETERRRLIETVEKLNRLANEANDRFDAGDFRNGQYRSERIEWLQMCVENAKNVRGKRCY
jgi:hypothetical protein